MAFNAPAIFLLLTLASSLGLLLQCALQFADQRFCDNEDDNRETISWTCEAVNHACAWIPSCSIHVGQLSVQTLFGVFVATYYRPRIIVWLAMSQAAIFIVLFGNFFRSAFCNIRYPFRPFLPLAVDCCRKTRDMYCHLSTSWFSGLNSSIRCTLLENVLRRDYTKRISSWCRNQHRA